MTAEPEHAVDVARSGCYARRVDRASRRSCAAAPVSPSRKRAGASRTILAIMRDPARIPEMCRLLQRAWERVPDLRLGQLVIDAIGPSEPCREVFYAEESRTRRGLERLVRGGAPEPELPSHHEAELRWKTLEEPAPTTVSFDGARQGTFDVDMYFCKLLEARFGGEYREGSLGSPDADAIVRWLAILLARSEPDVVLLDLSALRYVWGDGMVRVFERIVRFDTDHPVDVVVLGGPASAPALGSLGLRVHTDPAAALDEAMRLAVQRSFDIGWRRCATPSSACFFYPQRHNRDGPRSRRSIELRVPNTPSQGGLRPDDVLGVEEHGIASVGLNESERAGYIVAHSAEFTGSQLVAERVALSCQSICRGSGGRVELQAGHNESVKLLR
jgi:hypothetical protein